MKVFDMKVICVDTVPTKVYQKIDGEEKEIYNGPIAQIPDSLDDIYIEEFDIKDRHLRLFIFE